MTLDQMIQDFIDEFGEALGDDLDFAVRAVRNAWLEVTHEN